MRIKCGGLKFVSEFCKMKQVTPQETSVLLTCKSEAIKDFVIGASVGAGLTWFGTYLLRLTLICYDTRYLKVYGFHVICIQILSIQVFSLFVCQNVCVNFGSLWPC